MRSMTSGTNVIILINERRSKMSLSRTKRPWVINPDGSQGFVWNPINQISKHPKKHLLNPTVLIEPYRIRKPSRILTCLSTDLFSPLNRENWIGEILFLMNGLPRHDFIVVTGQAEAILKWRKFIPKEGVWLGVRLKSQRHMKRLFCLRMADTKVNFILIESLKRPIELNLFGLNWIVMEGNSKGKLAEEAVRPVLEQARHLKIPIFLKANLNHGRVIREFPNEHRDSEKA